MARQPIGHRGGNGVLSVAAVVVLLSVVLSSQTAAPPSQGRGQPPPPPRGIVFSGPDEVFSEVGISRGRISEARVPIPAGNELTEARVDLGRRLFLDPMLSRDRSVSCSTCHRQDMAFADDKPLAVGIAGRVGKRHSPSLVNRGLGRVQFWDGRAATLEALALMPLRDVNEMDLPPDEAVVRLSADPSYVAAFQAAFGRSPSAEDMGRALASFVRVIRSEKSAYDRFVAGDKTALTDEQQRGLQVFRTRGRCTICHSEPTFTDENFQNTGVAWRPNAEGPGGAFQDDGQFAVSRNERDRGKFKTPTLREIARTAPYMHDGSLATLEAVVDFYDKGGRPNPNLFPVIRPLGLSPEEKQVLVKFLGSLSGDVTSTMLPRDRTSPDFAGTWTPLPAPTGATPPSVPLWDDLPVTITQSVTFLTIATIRSRAQPLARLAYSFNGSSVRITDRSRPAGLEQISTRASWRDWQLVLTTTEPVRAADGTVSTQKIVHVLSLDSPSSMKVHVTRQGERPESWTVLYEKKEAPPR
jgi:cytochrome c peroxidase